MLSEKGTFPITAENDPSGKAHSSNGAHTTSASGDSACAMAADRGSTSTARNRYPSGAASMKLPTPHEGSSTSSATPSPPNPMRPSVPYIARTTSSGV